MTRIPRSQVQHGWFHVMNRGVDRQDIFSNDGDRRLFLALVAEYADQLDIEIHAYCLMTTHFHLIVHCPNGGLSEFVQQFSRRYAEAFNQRVAREGPVFTSRFVSVPLVAEGGGSPDRPLMLAVRYVHRNPLDLLPISALGSYVWSSYPCYVSDRPAPGWLTTTTVRTLQGDGDRLRRFTEASHPTDKTPAAGRSIDAYTADAVVQAVAASARIGVDEVLRKRSGCRNDARLIAAHLCTTFRVDSAAVLAELFGLETAQGFRQLAARGKNCVAIDASSSSLKQRALERLWTAEQAA